MEKNKVPLRKGQQFCLQAVCGCQCLDSGKFASLCIQVPRTGPLPCDASRYVDVISVCKQHCSNDSQWIPGERRCQLSLKCYNNGLDLYGAFQDTQSALTGFQVPFILVNCNSTTWGRLTEARLPFSAYSPSDHHFKHTAVRRGKMGEVSCPRTQRPWHNWPGRDQTADPPNIGRHAPPPEPR